MTAPPSAPVTLDRALAERALVALRATLTRAGHLAQRVSTEHLGYCGWRSESPRCVEQRALIDELAAVLGDQGETDDDRHHD